MKRKWNWRIWIGFGLVVASFLAYPLFVMFPITRDFPWANVLLLVGGGVLLITGLFRAFGNPAVYRGRVFGSIFAVLTICVSGLFAYGLFYEFYQVPPSTGAPRVGQKAPGFTLPDQNKNPVSLKDLVAGSKGVVLIFYRGFW